MSQTAPGGSPTTAPRGGFRLAAPRWPQVADPDRVPRLSTRPGHRNPPSPSPPGERVAEGRVRGPLRAKDPLTGPAGHLSPTRGEGEVIARFHQRADRDQPSSRAGQRVSDPAAIGPRVHRRPDGRPPGRGHRPAPSALIPAAPAPRAARKATSPRAIVALAPHIIDVNHSGIVIADGLVYLCCVGVPSRLAHLGEYRCQGFGSSAWSCPRSFLHSLPWPSRLELRNRRDPTTIAGMRPTQAARPMPMAV